jgi:uncharacterized protein YjbI with pentapeptide repeats
MNEDNTDAPSITPESISGQISQEDSLQHNTQSWEKINNSLELLLSDKKLLNSLFDDFLIGRKITINDLGQEETKILAPKGLSFGTTRQFLKFALSHPRESWYLLKLARSPEIYLNPDYQKSILKKDKLWDFVKERSGDLSAVGAALSKFGIREFQEGNILDQKGLDILKLALNDDRTLERLKEIAILTRSSPLDVMKITGDSLMLLAENPYLREFLREKGRAIELYVKDMANSVTRNDVTYAVDASLSNERYKVIQDIVKANPELHDRLVDLCSKNFIAPTLETEKVIISLMTLPEFSALSLSDRDNLRGWSEDALVQTKPVISGYLDFYKIDRQILDHLPTLLTRITDIEKIFQSIQNDAMFVWVDKTLDVLIQEPSLREFISQKPEFIPDLAKGVIEGTPFVKETTEKLGLNNEILDLLDTLLVKPEIASSIVKSFNKGDYVELTDHLITALIDPELPKLAPLLQSQAQEGLFNSLIIGIIEQSQPVEGKPSLSDTLSNYGITRDNIAQITNIFPILLDRPQALQEVFSQFKLGQYTEMTITLLSMVEENSQIKEYFKENQEMFVSVLDKVFANSPALKEYDLKGDLYEILPSLLNHPKELIEMIELAKQSKYNIIGEKFLDLMNKDQQIKEYFQDHGNKFKRIAEKMAGLEVYGIEDEVTKILSILMKDEHTPKIKSMLDLYQKGEWTNLIKAACTLIENDTEFKQYIDNNRENFAKIIDAIIDKSPMMKAYTQNADIGHLASAIIKNPVLIREGIEAYETSSKLGYVRVIAKSALNPELRNAFVQAAKSWVLSGDSGKYDLVNNITRQLSSRTAHSDGSLLKLSDFVTSHISKLNLEESEQTRLNSLLSKNILFDNVTIKGTNVSKARWTNLEIENTTFVNSEIRDVSFQGTKFSNVSFTGANLSDVDFTNAVIDSATLRSMIHSVKECNIALDGAIITGDISGIDLSGISLKNADLTGVSAMREVNLLGCNLTGARLPHGLLLDTYNLSHAIIDRTESIKRITDAQKENVINKAVDGIAERAMHLERQTLSPASKVVLANTIRELSRNPIIGEYLANTLEATPLDITEKNFPIRREMLSHVSEYQGTTGSLMSDLYENRENVNSIRNVVIATMMADKITEKLFGAGDNRALEGHMIQEMMKSAIDQFAVDNPKIDTTQLLTSDKGNQLVEDISNELRSKSKYTKAGLVTSGIHITKEVFNIALTNRCKVRMNDALGQYKFNAQELEGISKLSNKIAHNLFGVGADSNRKDDSDLILQSLKEVFYQVKKEKNGADLSNILDKASVQAMAGSVDKGMFTTTRTGLTELYYNSAHYTKAGYISGGIYLDEKNIVNTSFLDSIKSLIHPITDKVQALPAITDSELENLVHSIHRSKQIVKASDERAETHVERASRNTKSFTTINM